MDPLVSVIIPSYNYRHYLDLSLQSVLAQEYRNIEIIVVDDGSTDGTDRFVAEKYPQVTYLRQTNQGIGAARNLGLRNATGDYRILLDADDVLPPDVVRSQVGRLEESGAADISICRAANVWMTGERTFRMQAVRLKAGEFDLHLCYSNLNPVHSFCMRSSVTDRVGFFREGFSFLEDYDYWLRCVLAGIRFVANADCCILYNQHTQSALGEYHSVSPVTTERRCHLGHVLRTVPDFPAAGRFCGFLAHAAGCLRDCLNGLPGTGTDWNRLLREAKAALRDAERCADPCSDPDSGSSSEARRRAVLSEYYAISVLQQLLRLQAVMPGQLAYCAREAVVLKRYIPQLELSPEWLRERRLQLDQQYVCRRQDAGQEGSQDVREHMEKTRAWFQTFLSGIGRGSV